LIFPEKVEFKTILGSLESVDVPGFFRFMMRRSLRIPPRVSIIEMG